MRNIDTIIIHYSDSPFGDAAQIRQWHTTADKGDPSKPWRDIGYHGVILSGARHSGDAYDSAEDGMIERGRDIDDRGAHCRGHNVGSIGVCLVGDKAPSARQLDALIKFIEICRVFWPIKKIGGHKDFESTDCPGFDARGWLVEQGICDASGAVKG